VAGHASLSHRFVLEYKRPPLRCVALEANFVLAHHVGGAAAFEYRSLVRIVAVSAVHLAFQHSMVVWQAEFCANFQVALKAGLGIFAGINDRVRPAAGLHMQAARAVTGFATLVFRILAFRLQTGVVGSLEVTRYFFVTVSTSLGPHKCRTRDAGGGHDGMRQGAARNGHQTKDRTAAGKP
jgi:hypothetical protein